MALVTWLLAGLLLTVAALSEKVRYDGHKVLQLFPETDQQVEMLEGMREAASLNLDFWTGPHKNRPMEVHVDPEDEKRFMEILDEAGIFYHVVIDNLQDLIDEEEKDNSDAHNRRKRDSRGWGVVNVFARTQKIYDFIDLLAKDESFASVETIGKTFEGRPIKLLKLSTGPNKPAVFIDGGIHAREWLAQATVVWLINRMVSGYGKDSRVTSLLDKFDWYLLPVANPDGYEYTHTADRMWRKNRNQYGSGLCVGADPNRNFDYPQFGGVGTSNFPCSDIYLGKSGLSEAESAAIANKALSMKDSLKMYVNLHAYGTFWFTPWGFDARMKPGDAHELERVANIGANAIRALTNTNYRVGSVATLLYPAAGGTIDWMKGVAGVPYTYALELPPYMHNINHADSRNFIAKSSDIEPCGTELFAAFEAIIHEIHLKA